MICQHQWIEITRGFSDSFRFCSKCNQMQRPVYNGREFSWENTTPEAFELQQQILDEIMHKLKFTGGK